MGTAGGTVTIKLTVEQRQALQALSEVKSKLGGLVSVGAGIGAALGLGSITAFAVKSIFASSSVRELDIALLTLAANRGISESTVRAHEQSLLDLGVTAEGTKRSLITLIENGADLTKVMGLARVAMDAAAIAQEDVESTLQAITLAIASGQTRLLRRYQLFIDATEANKKYAASIGKTADALTGEEQQQALMNAVLEKGVAIAGVMEKSQGEIGRRWIEMEEKIRGLLIAYGDLAQRGAGAVLGVIERLVDRTTAWAVANKDVIESKITQWCEDFAEKLERVVTWTGKHIDQIVRWGEIIAATMIIAKVGGLVKNLVTLAGALRGVSLAAGAGLGPIGWLIAAIAGLTAGIVYLTRRHKDHSDGLATLSARYINLSNKTNRTASETDDLKRISDILDAARPGYIARLNGQADATRGLGDAEAELARQSDPRWKKLREIEKDIAQAERLAGLRKPLPFPQTLSDFPATLTTPQIDWYRRGAPHLEGMREAGYRRLQELKAERGILLAQLTSEEQADWNKWGQQMGPPDMLAGIIPDSGDISKVSADAIKAWQTIIDNISQMRLAAISDSYDKERAAIGDKYAKIYADISGAKDTTAEQKADASALAYHEGYLVEIAALDRKHDADTKQAAEDTAKAKADLVLEEVDYKKALYAWDTAEYIKELERQLEAATLTAEEKEILEDKIRKARREKDIGDADAARDREKDRQAEIERTKDDIAGIFTEGAMAVHMFQGTIDSLAKYIEQRLVHKALDSLIDKLWEAVSVAKILAFIKGIGMFFSGGGGGGMPWPKTINVGVVDSGGLVRAPTVAGLAMNRVPEIVSPVPMMRSIVREELAAAGGRGTVFAPTINIPVSAFDTQSIETSLKTGELGDAIARSVRDAWLVLQTGR